MNRSVDSRGDLASHSTRCLPVKCRLAPPIPWNGCTATLQGDRRPPAERIRSVPSAVSNIIMKLLVKTKNATKLRLASNAIFVAA